MVYFLKFFFFSSLLILSLANIASGAATVEVYTVNYPLTYFAERIGGNHVKVAFPAPPDIDPAFWSPDPETIQNYQKADLIILNGADYAKWTQKVSLPMLRLVDTSRTFAEDLIKIQTGTTHSHGPAGEHSHAGTAFTTWLDFNQAAQQAEAIYLALSRKMVDLKSELTANYEALKKDLLELDEKMTTLATQLQGAPLLASHPIYQYLARRYNLNIKMVMWEPDADPGESQWSQIEDLLAEHQAGWMIWEDEPLASSEEQLRKLNVKSLVFSPCFSRPPQGDFLSVMKQNVSNFEQLVK